MAGQAIPRVRVHARGGRASALPHAHETRNDFHARNSRISCKKIFVNLYVFLYVAPIFSQNSIQIHLKITEMIESRLLHDRISQKSIQTRKMAKNGDHALHWDSNPRARGARSCVLTIEPTRRRTSSRTLIRQYIYTCIPVLYTVYAMHGNYYTHLYGRTTYKIWMMKTHTKMHPSDRTQPREKFTSPA